MSNNLLNVWGDALASRDTDRILSLYAPGALLLATLEDRPLVGPEEIRPYFVNLFKKPGLRCTFQRAFRIRPGVLAGLYTFKWDGGALPARFTFVFGPEGIEHHHSSELPPL